ncbi:TPA: phenylalanine--tRNA ligase subunit alpha [Candidatus Woesearchaeota archaeon]|nr:phenylalanine--tRNA ligase subunit alpha [Candidatus Woesearchaeota archaeon]
MSADITKLAQTLHPLERKVLPLLLKHRHYGDIVSASGLQPVEVMRAIQWLSNKKLAELHEEQKEVVKLDENGERYRKEGLPEKRFLAAIPGEATLAALRKSSGLTDEECAVCMGLLRKRDAIAIAKRGNDIHIVLTDAGKKLAKERLPEEQFLSKHFPLEVKSLTPQEKAILAAFQSRKRMVRLDALKNITVSLTPLGKALSKTDIGSRAEERLTSEMLHTGAWAKASFRRYDVATNVPQIHGGRRHYVEQAISHIKRIWLDLGFTEMEGNLVQTAFWDLDALFVPQDHPAREMQDTFYLKEPSSGKLPKALTQKIKDMHEHGGNTGSKGWGGSWSADLASKNLLRTHTTVLSAQTIAALKDSDIPAKYFTVGRVFRNEALSWKHLFEFTQVEGIVVDPEANFKHLKGYLSEFFQKMGFEKVRIRPAHFPYTEPSAEVDVFHPIKKTWVELGGAGIFRPEMVVPLLGKDVPVLAWGLGLERSIMEYYGFNDVRLLYQNDLKNLRESKLWMK